MFCDIMITLGTILSRQPQKVMAKLMGPSISAAEASKMERIEFSLQEKRRMQSVGSAALGGTE